LFQRSLVQIPEWATFLQFRFIFRIYYVSLIKRSKNPNITQIGSRLSGQRTSILFQRSQVQILEWATVLQFRFIFRIYYVSFIPEHFEPGPTWPGPSPARARPAHELYWAGVGRDLEAREIFFWSEPGPKCCI
jgi:hypothetical protein